MGQTGSAVQTVTRAAPDVAALILAVSALAQVAVVIPRGGHTARSASSPDLASRAGSAGRTDAGVTCYTIYAGGAASAWIARTFVHVDTAVRAGEASRAFAPEPIDTVDAFAAIQAGQWLTIVHIALTIRPLETFPADTTVITVSCIHAGRTILAGITRTRRRRDMAGRAFPTGRAVTRETVATILTGAAVSASTWLTVTATQRACLALPAAPADAREVCHAVHACTIVAAGLS